MALAGEFRVDLEALASSATYASGQGEDLAIAHIASDNRMMAAQQGGVGESAAAIAAKADAWLATSKTLLTRLGHHALALNNDAIDFAAMDRENAEMLRAIGVGVDGAAGVAQG